MRYRVVISGIIAGVILCVYYPMLGSLANETNREGNLWLNVLNVLPDLFVVLGAPGLVLFISGWSAARWSWSRSWKSSFLAGAGCGLVAGILLFCFYGIQFIYDVALLFFDIPAFIVSSLFLALFGGITPIFLQFSPSILFFLFAVTIVSGLALGALGGLASMLIDGQDVWGKPARAHPPALFRLSVYYLVLNGLFNAILLFIVTSLIDKAIIDSVRESLQAAGNLQSATSWFDILVRVLSLFVSVMTSMFLFLVPTATSQFNTWKIISLDIFLALTWGWMLREWIVERKRPILSGLWLLLSLGGSGYWYITRMLNVSFVNTLGFTLFDMKLLLIIPNVIFAILTLLVWGIAFRIGWNIKFAPDVKWLSYRFSDYLGYALTCAVLGGVQALLGVVYCILFIMPLSTFINLNWMAGIISFMITTAGKIYLLIDGSRFLSFLFFGSGILIIMIINMLSGLALLWFRAFFQAMFKKKSAIGSVTTITH